MLEFPVDTCSKFIVYDYFTSSLLFLNSLKLANCRIADFWSRSSPHSLASAAVLLLATRNLSTVLGNFHSDG